MENEILMHFRAQRKSAQDISLSDYIETGSDGAPLELMEVVSEEGDLMEQLADRETAAQLHRAIDSCLSRQEKQVVLLRYGLDGRPPKRQREVAELTGISRSYVSRIEKRALQKLRARLDSEAELMRLIADADLVMRGATDSGYATLREQYLDSHPTNIDDFDRFVSLLFERHQLDCERKI